MARLFVYLMKGLSKTYPGGPQVLKDIWFSFNPGAKIGIIGISEASNFSGVVAISGDAL